MAVCGPRGARHPEGRANCSPGRDDRVGSPPGAPRNLQAANITPTGFTVSWSAPGGEAVTGYQFRLQNESGWTPTGATSQQFGGFPASSAHVFEVQARDAAGNWSAGAILTVNTAGATGGPGVAGKTFWTDTNGDGILDKVTGSNSDEFNYRIGAWYSTAPYGGLNLNGYLSAWTGHFGSTVLDEFFLRWTPPVEIWTTGEWFVDLNFEMEVEANRPLKIYKDPSGLPDISPGRWELVLNLPGFSTAGLQVISYQLNAYMAGALYQKQLFLVEEGKPVGGLNFNLPDDVKMIMNASGLLGRIILPSGTTITTNGSSASVTGYGTVGAGGSLTLPGGTTVSMDGSGRMLVTFPNGVAVTTAGAGSVSLNVPSGLSGISAQVLDTAGRILNVANNGVVFSVRNAIGQLLNLPNGGVLDQLPDLGINVLTGELLIAARIGTQSDAQAVSMPLTAVSLDIFKGGGSAVTAQNTLKVAKWENAFNDSNPSSPQLKPDFIDLDPDRFFLRMVDTGRRGQGSVNVTLSTKNASGEILDDATTIQLTETGANTGIFQSQTMILVSDGIDDAASGTDNATNDRTHKVELGGKVRVDYTFTNGLAAEREFAVPAAKTVDVKIVILRQTAGGSPVISVAAVQNIWKVAQERFAQIGVKINVVSIQERNPPAGVDLGDGLTVNSPVLSAEAKALIADGGSTNTLSDIHVFYVNTIRNNGIDAAGVALSDPSYDESEENYLDNAFIANNPSMPWAGYVAAHELTHILLGGGGHTSVRWRLMYEAILQTTQETGSRRLTDIEQTFILQNPHAY